MVSNRKGTYLVKPRLSLRVSSVFRSGGSSSLGFAFCPPGSADWLGSDRRSPLHQRGCTALRAARGSLEWRRTIPLAPHRAASTLPTALLDGSSGVKLSDPASQPASQPVLDKWSRTERSAVLLLPHLLSGVLWASSHGSRRLSAFSAVALQLHAIVGAWSEGGV